MISRPGLTIHLIQIAHRCEIVRPWEAQNVSPLLRRHHLLAYHTRHHRQEAPILSGWRRSLGHVRFHLCQLGCQSQFFSLSILQSIIMTTGYYCTENYILLLWRPVLNAAFLDIACVTEHGFDSSGDNQVNEALWLPQQEKHFHVLRKYNIGCTAQKQHA